MLKTLRVITGRPGNPRYTLFKREDGGTFWQCTDDRSYGYGGSIVGSYEAWKAMRDRAVERFLRDFAYPA